MKCRINRCLLVAVVFILAAGCAARGNMLLVGAASTGDTEKVQSLLAKGADVNAKEYWGRTALMRANSRGHKEIVQLLKKAGQKNDLPASTEC